MVVMVLDVLEASGYHDASNPTYLQFEWGSLLASGGTGTVTSPKVEIRQVFAICFMAILYDQQKHCLYSLYFIISISHIQNTSHIHQIIKVWYIRFHAPPIVLYFLGGPLAPVLSSHEQELGSLGSPIA